MSYHRPTPDGTEAAERDRAGGPAPLYFSGCPGGSMEVRSRARAPIV